MQTEQLTGECELEEPNTRSRTRKAEHAALATLCRAPCAPVLIIHFCCRLLLLQVFREIRIHASLQHQNIITIFCTFQVCRGVGQPPVWLCHAHTQWTK